MMQDPKKINVTSGVVSNGKIYSLEFHEDNHDANMKVTDQGVSTYYPIGGSGGGTTDYIGNLELVDNGLTLDITGVGNAFNTTLDVTSLRSGMVASAYLSGNSPATVYTGGSTPASIGYVVGDWTIDLDTSNMWYLANANTNTWVQSQSVSGGGETNIIPYSGGSIDTDTTSLLALRDDALKLNLMRSSATNVDFVFEADSNFLTNAKFGIITLQVSINTTGGGGIKLMYKDMTGSVVHVASGVHQTSGNHAITFAYFGSSSLQLIAFSEY